MKPESVRLVAEAIYGVLGYPPSDGGMGPGHASAAQAAIRAVMQTDEVRGLVEAAGNVVAWCEKLDLLRPDAAKLKEALSQLENKQ